MRKIFILLTVLCYGLMAMAMPARPGWHTIKQIDGTTLRVQAVGNAFNSAILTTDGLMVARGDDGDFYYKSSITGLTTVRAHDASQRTPAETAFVTAQRSNLVMAGRQNLPIHGNQTLGVGGSNADVGVPSLGSRRIPIILVEFTDKKFNNTREDIIDAMLTGDKSVGQYFRDQSNGLYEPDFDVFGIYSLSQNREYYGGHQGDVNDKGLGWLVTEAVQLAAADGVSFKPYDTNSDNYCDVVIVIYAGVGEAGAPTTYPEAVWPCNWDLNSASYYSGGNGPFQPSSGDPIVNNFAVFNELYGGNDNGTTIDGIGTFTHEFSHCLGLPDFYDTGGGDHYGLGYWDLLCLGCYNDDGFTPPGYSAYEKVFMGWANYITPEPGTYYILPAWNQKNADTDKALCITSDINRNEYFVVEYRKKQGWDRYLPGEGIMITHVTYNASRWRGNSPNNQDIQLMTLMNADNSWSYYDEDGDLWPWGGNNAFTDRSTPAAKLNMKANGSITGNAGYLGKPITNMVINSNGTASFWYMREAANLPELIAMEDVIDFGDVMLGNTATASLGILGANLTSDVWMTMEDIEDSSLFGVTPSTISADQVIEGTELTLNFSPTELGEFMTMVYINSEGAEPVSVLLAGRGVVKGYTPVMLPADSNFIDLTQFRADWTDQTPAENVESYTLEVSPKPKYSYLETADFSDAPSVTDGNYLADISGNYTEYLPEGWTCTPGLYSWDGYLISAFGGSISTPTYHLQGYDKVSVVVRAMGYAGAAEMEVSTSMGSQEISLGENNWVNYTIVLDCANADAVTFTNVEGFNAIKQVEVYAGDLTAARREASESGDDAYRLITDITDKFYTVKDLQAGGSYIYKVKAHYIDGTESGWSNIEHVTLYDNAHPYALGDVNHDHVVNVSDVTLLIAYILGADETCCPICGNVNPDEQGVINVADVTVLIKKILEQ